MGWERARGVHCRDPVRLCWFSLSPLCAPCLPPSPLRVGVSGAFTLQAWWAATLIGGKWRMVLAHRRVTAQWSGRWQAVQAEAATRLECFVRRHFAVRLYNRKKLEVRIALCGRVCLHFYTVRHQ